MLGGAIAAREGRLLSLSTAEAFPRGQLAHVGRLFSYGTAAAVAIFLCAASVEFVSIEREGGQDPRLRRAGVGGAAACCRSASGSSRCDSSGSASSACSGRAVAASARGASFVVDRRERTDRAGVDARPALVVLGLRDARSARRSSSLLGGAALILFWRAEFPIAAIPVENYRLVVNPTLPTIPLFTLAGYLLAEGGASKRLIRVFQALFGWMRGGPAIVYSARVRVLHRRSRARPASRSSRSAGC